MKERRSYKCPKCGYHLLAREDGRVICLSPTCDWSTDVRRKEDYEIADISNLKKEFYG
jgi:uncharacterized Zn finger protein (UPF0148 family)